jgi:hypothetical protein
MNILTLPFTLLGRALRGAWNAMFPPVTYNRVAAKAIEEARIAQAGHIASMEQAELDAKNHKAKADMYAKRIKRLQADLEPKPVKFPARPVR